MPTPTYETIETDVLVIGAGGAGLRAAIEAREKGIKVLIVTKEYLGGAHTGMAMGGLNVAIKPPASPKQHYEDTVSGGWHVNNHKLVKIFAKEMPDRIYDLERYGVKFDRLPDGSFYTWAGGKQSAPLNLCAGDYTGREIIEGLIKEVKRLDVAFLDDHFVSKLFLKSKRVIGALLVDLKKGTYTTVSAKATIVATGGGGMMYSVNTNAPSNTGEGYAWGLAAGAKLVDMEFVQFHPTGMAYPPKKKGVLVTEKVRGHGGILKNKHAERFMKRYQPQRLELAGRDEVTRAIYQEVQEERGTKHGGVYLDVTHWEKDSHEKLIPEVFREHMEVGIDIRKQMMEITPSMHHMMGGFRINEWGETNVPGLFACGEVTTSIHGANRLGGNSLSEGQVFGRRTGLRAASFAKREKGFPVAAKLVAEELHRFSLLQKRKGAKPQDLIKELKTLMWEKVGIIREGKGLRAAQREIQRLKRRAKRTSAKGIRGLQAHLELEAMLKVAETIVVAALLRTESRGAHYRKDYPQMDKRWEKNIVVYQKSGKLRTKIVPVV